MSSQRANQLIEAGLWLRLSGDVQGAQRLFERALELDPTNTRAREYLAAAAGAPSRGAATPFERPAELEPTLGRLAPTDADLPVSPALEGDWGAWAEGQGGPSDGGGKSPSAPVVLPEALEGTPADVLELLSRDVVIEFDEPVIQTKGDTDEFGIPDGHTQEFGLPVVESELDLLLRGAEDLLELDDHSGAVDLLFKAKELAPSDVRVESLRARSERMLMARLESKLGDLGRVPAVRLQPDDIIWLNLDHRAGFVLAQIDGSVSYEDLFSLSGMTRLDTARILVQLIDEGVISAG
ncbi:tetratricopeptide repeat protein [Myxococcus sp. AM010]|uniref:tetratricopeptide repeat protein n=1 Tax=Myxococcus sp. AM010 TaxID=2745138 RepID=UPI00159500BC|nr:tetratricopeptide repeat protein [Myxococcus sp. AM010]NVJ16364.1 tetratricopeptide repeat protein [Myxococcus sp. AM010]